MADFVRVDNFSLHHTSDFSTIFVSEKEIVRVTSPNAEAILRELIMHDRKLIPSQDFFELCKQHNVDPEDVVELLKHSITWVKRSHTIDQTVVVSESAYIHDVVKELLTEWNITSNSSSDPALIVVFLEQYDATRIRALYQAASDQSLFLTCHLYDEHFIIDGMYRKDLKLPCHFCHRESFAAHRIKRYGASEDQWYSLTQSLGLSDRLLEPRSYQLNNATRQMIGSAIYFRLKTFLAGDPHLATLRPGFWTRYSLKTGERTSGLVPHHPQCGCTTGEW